MDSDKKLQIILLNEIKAIPLGNSPAGIPSAYFFQKVNNINTSIRQGEFEALKSIYESISAREKLQYSQGLVDYNLKLLIDQGCVEGFVTGGAVSESIVVIRLTQKGHDKLSEETKCFISRVLSEMRKDAPLTIAKEINKRAVRGIVFFAVSGVSILGIVNSFPHIKEFIAHLIEN